MQQVRVMKINENESLLTCRESLNDAKTKRGALGWDKAGGYLVTEPVGVRHGDDISITRALMWNAGTFAADAKRNDQVVNNCKVKSINAAARVRATHSSDEAVERQWSEGVALLGLACGSTSSSAWRNS